jgi:hypothetical protein
MYLIDLLLTSIRGHITARFLAGRIPYIVPVYMALFSHFAIVLPFYYYLLYH